MADPKKDEHIEELLSKLQGIFGKLSHSEEEEAKQTIEVPAPAPKEKEPPKEKPLKKAVEPEKPPPAPEPPTPINLYAESNGNPPAPEPPKESPVAVPPIPPASAPPAAAMPGEGAYETLVPTEDPERLIVPTAVYFPVGRDKEASSLAGKLETMAPKFTKVAFRLRVCVFMPYDPKSDWKDALVGKAAENQIQTIFFAVDRSLEDAKKKAIVGELEMKNVYFQEVPINMIEKKAYYTDILLGLVFFFDSRKPPASDAGQV